MSSPRSMSANCQRDDVGVEQVPATDAAGPGARPRPDLDEPLGLQHLDGLADHRAADAELGRQLVLVRAAATPRPTRRDDPPSELVDDPAVQAARRSSRDRSHRPAIQHPAGG